MTTPNPVRTSVPRAKPNGPSAAFVAAELRKALARGDLLPGSQVRQIEWAKRLGVSQVPVREALKTLAAEKLLEQLHNRGYFVHRFSLAEMTETYLMRRLLERELLLSLRWPDQASLRRLRRVGHAARDALTQGDVYRWDELDHDFQRELHSLSPMTVIPVELDRLWLLTNVYRTLWQPASPEMLRQPASFYVNVLEALTNRDRDRLLELFETQLKRAEATYAKLLGPRDQSVPHSRRTEGESGSH